MVLCTLASCARSSIVPRSDYSGLEQGGGRKYEVRTTDGRSHTATHFSVTPDAIVIHRMLDSEERTSLPVNVVIPLEDVESIRRISPAGHAEAFLVGILAVATLTAVGYLVLEAVAGSSF
jgi:hypothetical protein